MSTTLDRPRLTRDKVIDAAADIASRDGLEHLSMRTLAEELGVSTMAAYRHIGRKRELIDALLLRALGQAMLERKSEGEAADVDQASLAVEYAWLCLDRFEGLRFELRHPGSARDHWAAWLEDESGGRGSMLIGLLVGMESVYQASRAARLVVS